jgi:hypothetical protein
VLLAFGKKMKRRITIIVGVLSLIAVVGAFLILAILPRGLSQGPLTFSMPSKESVVGTYSVESISWFVPSRRELKKVSLSLSNNGTYQLHTQHNRLFSPLIPALSGQWTISPMRGMDLGSRETWGVRFASALGVTTEAWLLEEIPPYRIMFSDYSRRSHVGELLILKKAEQ